MHSQPQQHQQIHVKWSSETGHALDIAKQLALLLHSVKLTPQSLLPLDSDTQLHPGYHLFVVSTTGQGQPNYSMRTLWKNMLKKNYKLSQGVHFAIYSVGDRSYGDNFGLAARKLRQRLKMLGGNQIVEIGLGDDQDPLGCRQVYASGWSQSLIETLKQLIPTQKHQTQLQQSVSNFPQQIRHLALPITCHQLPNLSIRSHKQQIQFEVTQITQLTSRKQRKVYWLQLTLPSQVRVAEGDVLEIYPQNRQEDVDYMLTHFNMTGEQTINYLGMNLTLRDILTSHVNLSSTLNQLPLLPYPLLGNITNPQHSLKLQQFSNDYDQYHNYIVKYKRNVVQFLRDFKEVKMEVEYFLKYCGQMVGRKYSIAKIAHKDKASPNSKVYILLKLVEQQITEGRFFKGLCSHDLLTLGLIRKARILRGDITPNQVRQHNLIVTLGTGIAPFIWMINQLATKNNSRTTLIYTNSYKDQLYHRMLCQPQGKHHEEKELNAEKEVQGWTKGTCSATNGSIHQILSCTQQGGPRLLQLLDQHLQSLKIDPTTTRLFLCGPKQLHTGILIILSKITHCSPQELNKHKMIVYQNW